MTVSCGSRELLAAFNHINAQLTVQERGFDFGGFALSR
jgi:hypothetical protein